MKPALAGVGWWGVLVLLAGVAQAKAAEPALVRYQTTQPQMGVPFTIILYAESQTAANAAFAAAFSRVAQLNKSLSDYDSESELSRLSRTAPTSDAVPVSDDLWPVLARSQRLAAATGGAFDVTVGPYVRLWRRARRSKEMPSDARLAEARAAVGYQKLHLDEARHTAKLLVGGMRLDLGGIGIGYAVDEAMKELHARGIRRVLIDASGDILAGEPPPGKPGWKIGVVPLSAEGTPSREILLTNVAVATSGDAFQHVDIGGKRYSHIVDPRTGLGLTDRTAVTVIARDCMTADALDTAANVLGPKAGLALVEETPGAAAFIVRAVDTGPSETYESSRFGKFLTENPPQR